MGSTVIDYSPFLHVLENGSLWWRLEDAIKLGAGYLPVSDDEQNLNPVLRAKNNQIRANERTLLSEFNQDHYTEANLQLLVREDGRYVEAREFLNWLTQYISLTQSPIPFPNDLIRAVRLAVVPPVVRTEESFNSLTVALEVWFDKPMEELPDEQRHRVETDFFPMPWNDLSQDQRRSVAEQWDYQHNPAMESDRQYWWDFYQRMQALEDQIEQWNFIATPTATDLMQKESRLAELQRELTNMKKEEKQPYRNTADLRHHKVDVQTADVAHSADRPKYIAYPKAMKLLTQRLDATPEELAAWLFFGPGPELGGLTAYLNANELNPPPKFYYNVGGDSFDYLSPLMACWFREEDVTNFKPIERYITGKALIERWSKQLDIQPEAYILAKISESRLQDYHPIYGGTKATFSESEFFPPLETGLFALSHIKEIEAEDFSNNESDSIVSKHAGHLNHDHDMQKQANDIAAELELSKKRTPTKYEVAKKLAEKLGMSTVSVLRRIRATWKKKSPPKYKK
ncbi:MAG: hypothetical protein Q8S55_14770 [Methylococcaceae bacterium]|nr:hypothetical protein [Methylococcaceae bacterium]